MDGYAVKKGDKSKNFRVMETVAAGNIPLREIKEGECARIMTGAMMPAGTDKVVRVEYITEKMGTVSLIRDEADNNVISRGENLKKGEGVLQPRVLKVQDIGILASLGMERVKVAIPPTVGIITTGTELRQPGEELKPGEIYNSNGPQLMAHLASMGSPYRGYGTVSDRPEEIREKILTAIAENDIVLLSGGVSMGKFDYVPSVLKENGVDIKFHRIAFKPGKPTLFGIKGETFIFGLPGNPVSTFVIFEVFVKVLIYRWQGIDYQPAYKRAKLTESIKRRNTERVEMLPVRVTGDEIELLNYHGSSHLNILNRANGLVRVKRGVDYIEEGTELNVRQI
ncbi:MAG: molybdopterin molybdenumtransferase MoeA [Spirochaeta sp.]|nr:molybdopterin molybdenumtransferase MoeA [Spirochaeta sp.]